LPSKRYEIVGAHGEALYNVKKGHPQSYYRRATAERALSELRRTHGPLPASVRLVVKEGPSRSPARLKRGSAAAKAWGKKMAAARGATRSTKVGKRSGR
jgi:hypothetical protein